MITPTPKRIGFFLVSVIEEVFDITNEI